MIIAGIYSFNRGREMIEKYYYQELKEVEEVIKNVNSETKISKEKTMTGKVLYHPSKLNKLFQQEFQQKGWQKFRINCDYPQKYYERIQIRGSIFWACFSRDGLY